MINEYLKIVLMKINGNTTALLHVCLHLERDVCCIQDSGDDRLLAGSTAFTDKTLLPHISTCITKWVCREWRLSAVGVDLRAK